MDLSVISGRSSSLDMAVTDTALRQVGYRVIRPVHRWSNGQEAEKRFFPYSNSSNN